MSVTSKFRQIKKTAKRTADKIGDSEIMDRVTDAGEFLADKAGDLKDTALDVKEDINEKITELDRMLEQAVTDYNDAYTLMNDKGTRLYIERCRAVDVIDNIENLVNSIANHPKEFDTDFETIEISKRAFKDTCEFAEKELRAAREAAGGIGAGLAAGATVALMGPTAAMWVATTFGTASTGAAISTLSGAAATNAALAWLGGGTLAAGGGGMAGGSALLVLAGPVGVTILGAAVLSSVVVITKKRIKLNKEKNEEIESVKENTEKVKEVDAAIDKILKRTSRIAEGVRTEYNTCLSSFGSDYSALSDDQKKHLGAMVNNTKALSALFEKTIAQ